MQIRFIMSDQLKEIIVKAKLNFAILVSILALAIVGKFTGPEFTNTVFVTAGRLVSDLYSVFIAITLSAFIPNFKLVVFGSIGIFIGAAILIQLGIFTYLTTNHIFVILIVILGFASIANLYRHHREVQF